MEKYLFNTDFLIKFYNIKYLFNLQYNIRINNIFLILLNITHKCYILYWLTKNNFITFFNLFIFVILFFLRILQNIISL